MWLTSVCSASFPGEQRAAVGRAQPEAMSPRGSGAGARSVPAWAAPTAPWCAHGALGREVHSYTQGLSPRSPVPGGGLRESPAVGGPATAHPLPSPRSSGGSQVRLEEPSWEWDSRVCLWGTTVVEGNLGQRLGAGACHSEEAVGTKGDPRPGSGQDSPHRHPQWNRLCVRQEGGGHTGARGAPWTKSLR